MTRGPTATERWVRFGLADHEQHWWLTAGAAAALVVALGMALFGLPPVDLHGPLHRVGIMDPLCGGTRAARYTALGQLGLAWKYNPLGIAVVLAAAFASTRTVAGLIWGRWLTVSVSWTTSRRRFAIVVMVVVLAALEVRQQLIADLLTAPR